MNLLVFFWNATFGLWSFASERIVDHLFEDEFIIKFHNFLKLLYFYAYSIFKLILVFYFSYYLFWRLRKRVWVIIQPISDLSFITRRYFYLANRFFDVKYIEKTFCNFSRSHEKWISKYRIHVFGVVVYTCKHFHLSFQTCWVILVGLLIWKNPHFWRNSRDTNSGKMKISFGLFFILF